MVAQFCSDGQCPIHLRGYSTSSRHAGPGAVTLAPDKLVGVAETETGEQEQYGPESLRRLLRCYAKNEIPRPFARKFAATFRQRPSLRRTFCSAPTPRVPARRRGQSLRG